jgi:hypothetical protein
MLDLSSENVAFAQQKAAKLGLHIHAIPGNALEADKFGYAPFFLLPGGGGLTQR